MCIRDRNDAHRLVGCNSLGAATWDQIFTRVLPDGRFACSDAPGKESIATNRAVYKASRQVYPEYFKSGYPFVLKCSGPWRVSDCFSEGVLTQGDSVFYRYQIVQHVGFHFLDPDADRDPPLSEHDILTFDKWVRNFVRETSVQNN